MRRFIWMTPVVVALFLSVVSCSSYRHCPWRTGKDAEYGNAEYSLRFIESDDEGWFWDRRQVDGAMELIRDKVQTRDTIVIMFVHGWHHSAECCDGNVEGFRNTLSNLHTLGPSYNIVGLYVGWRGKSLPMPLDYATFWGRKSAAERIGQNDLKELVTRLQQLLVEYRPDARLPGSRTEGEASEKPHNFLGLVSIGHSFGAQVLMSAVMEPLEDQLQRLNRNPTYLRDAKLVPPMGGPELTITGFGDLVVLINPAVEASQYHRLHLLSQGLRYSPLQTPVMLTVSAENDKVNHRLFTFGRVLGEFFTGKPHKDNAIERTVERQALGVYRGHVTHQLTPVDKDVKLSARTITGDSRQCHSNQSCKSAWYAWTHEPVVRKPNSLTRGDSKLPEFDFSYNVVFSNVELSPLTSQAIQELHDEPQEYGTPLPYQPFIVARASKTIIDDHSGIFTEPFLRFLVPYIAYIEQKSKLNVRTKQKRRESELKAIEGQRSALSP